MKNLWHMINALRNTFRLAAAFLLSAVLAAPLFAQTGTSPWENAVGVLQQAFTSTIARGLSLVAIVVSGLTFVVIPIDRQTNQFTGQRNHQGPTRPSTAH